MVGWSVERHGRSKAEECGAFRERVESFGDGILENGGVRVQGSGGETRPGFPPDMHINTIPAAAANHPVPSPPSLSHWFSRLVIYIYIYIPRARAWNPTLLICPVKLVLVVVVVVIVVVVRRRIRRPIRRVYILYRGEANVAFGFEGVGGGGGEGRPTISSIDIFWTRSEKKSYPYAWGASAINPLRGGGREGRRVHPPRHFYY